MRSMTLMRVLGLLTAIASALAQHYDGGEAYQLRQKG